MKLTALWVAICACFAFGYSYMGGNLNTLAHPYAALMVFGPCAAMLFYCFGGTTFDFFGRAFMDQLNDNDLENWDRVSTVGMFCGGIGAVFGLMQCMMNLADSTQLGTGIALAFTCFFYGMVPSLVNATLKRGKSKSAAGAGTVRRLRAAGFVTSGFLALLTCLFVALFSLGH